MQIDYNVDKPSISGRGGWRNGGRPLSKEIQAILDFLETDNENMVFTYENTDIAKKKADSIRVTVKRKEIPINILKKNNQIFIERKPDK